ncbi:hypothetical protein GW932_02865 [archaeon]|nr:hypothetical protein [archaeon]
MSKIYIVNCDSLKLFATFSTLNEVLSYLNDLNKTKFNSETFSIFGRGVKIDYDKNNHERLVDSDYYVDSVVLSFKENHNTYYKFFIRCINKQGNTLELN